MANSAIVGTLRAILSLDSAEFDAGMKRVAAGAKSWSKDLDRMGQQATALGQTLTAAITLPLAGIAAGSVKAAMDFESSFANVRKTVDATDEQFNALAASFRKMGKEIPVTTDELNRIAALGGQMGVSVDQLEKFTRHVAALGVAVDGISTEEAAAGLAQIGNIAGTGTKDIAEMASALVHLGNKSSATEAEILEFTKRLAGAGTTVGMTVAEVMALGTTMANLGINAEAGGTAMSTVIAKIGKAVSEGGDSLNNFAAVAEVSASKFAQIWKESPIQALDLFVKGLGTAKASGVDLNVLMGDLGTEGVRVADTLKRLSGAAVGVGETLEIANEGWRAGNKHLIEAEEKFKTTANQMKLLWAAIKDVGITIGNALLPGIQSMTQFLSGLIPILDKLAGLFAAMPGPLQAIAIGFGALVAAAGPALMLFGSMATGASALTAAFATNGIAMKALTGQFALLNSAMLLVGQAVAVIGVAFAGWQIGKWIGEVTGLTGAIQGLTEKVMGYRDASVPMDAQQRAINQAIKLGADETVTYAEAMAFLQKRGDALRASHAKTTEAAKAQTTQTIKLTTASEDASEAQEAYNKTIQAYISKLTGADLQQEVKKLTDAYNRLTPAQRENAFFTKQLEAEILRLADAGAKLPPRFDDIARRLQAARAGMELAKITVTDFGAAIKNLGREVELADPKMFRFETMMKNAQSGAEGAIDKLKDLGHEAQILQAPPEEPWRAWHGYVTGVIDDISYSMARSLTDMITGVTSFAEGWRSVWESIKNIARSILDDLLAYFIRDFIGGMLKGILGSNLGQVIGSVLSGGGITGAVAGAGAAAGGASGGSAAVGAATGGSAGATGGGLLAGLGTAAAFALPVALFFGLTSGDEWKPNAGWYDYLEREANKPPSFYESQEFKDWALMNPTMGGLTPDASDLPSFAGGTGGFVDFGTGTLAMLHGREAVVPEAAVIDPKEWGGGGSFSGNVYLDSRLVGRGLFAPIVREAARQQVTQR